eukprot:TRINITY_DN10784_c0_g1_i1.p1 TRINITY_DN10784_c0_g1~~TRINITY_DN10784_c0_g1_i1.p1  ORF type:complete len:185 (-),score=18.00 TRINITY_DN10784_c0_g1_i1:19-573(-)
MGCLFMGGLWMKRGKTGDKCDQSEREQYVKQDFCEEEMVYVTRYPGSFKTTCSTDQYTKNFYASRDCTGSPSSSIVVSASDCTFTCDLSYDGRVEIDRFESSLCSNQGGDDPIEIIEYPLNACTGYYDSDRDEHSSDYYSCGNGSFIITTYQGSRNCTGQGEELQPRMKWAECLGDSMLVRGCK